LTEVSSEDVPTLVGIDHVCSFPPKYFTEHGLPRLETLSVGLSTSLADRRRPYQWNLRPHPRYNPEVGGRSAIKAGCKECEKLFEIFQARVKLDVAISEFRKISEPWITSPKGGPEKSTAIAG